MTQRKGQTALEYLLIIVVMVSVVIAIVIWVNSLEVKPSEPNKICGTTRCTGNADCQIPACGGSGTCDTNTNFCQV